MRFLALSLMLLIPFSSTAATTRYVSTTGNDSTGTGAIGSPYATATKAISVSTSGDTILFRAGTYYQQVYTAKPGLTFASNPGELATFDGVFTNTVGVSALLIADAGANNTVFRDFNVCHANYSGVIMQDKLCMATNLFCYSNMEAGILIQNAGSNSTIINCRCFYNAKSNEKFILSRGSWSVGITACRGATGCLIQGNMCWNNWGEGISTFSVTNTVIVGNTSYDNQTESYLSDCRFVLLESNLIYSTANNICSNGAAKRQQAGLMIGDEAQNPPSYQNTIRNNLFFGNYNNIYAWLGGGMTNFVFAYNTFANAEAGSDANILIGGSGLNHPGCGWTNNIFVQNGSVPNLLIGGATNGMTFSHNDWFPSSSVAGAGAGDITTDPILSKTTPTTPGNLTYQWFAPATNSPVLKAGLALASVTTDYLDVTRGSPPSMGALDAGQATPFTRYVDPAGSSANDGLTAVTPWPIDYALAHIGAGGTIICNDGDYTKPTLDVINRNVTVIAANKWKARFLNCPATDGVFRCALGSDTSGCTIDGLQFTNCQSCAVLFREPSASNCVVRNCWVQHTGAVGWTPAQNMSGIQMYPISFSLAERNLCEYNGTNLLGFNHGIYYGGTNNVVRNNVCRYNGGYGIILDGHVVTGDIECYAYQNLIYGNTTGNATQQDQFAFYNDAASGTSSGIGTNYFFNNTIISVGAYAVLLQNGSIRFTNNIIIATNQIVHRFGTFTSDSILGDYNYCPKTPEFGHGPHDTIANSYGFVNTGHGLMWLTLGSGPRNKGLSITNVPVDFFGAPQSGATDIGFNQYSATYAADTRTTLDPSGVFPDYWTNLASIADPLITVQPQGQFVATGTIVVFTVTATGGSTLHYQWKRNGSNIGTDSSSYTTPAVTFAVNNNDLYSVVVSDLAGSVTSTSALLQVFPLPPFSATQVYKGPGITIYSAKGITIITK